MPRDTTSRANAHIPSFAALYDARRMGHTAAMPRPTRPVLFLAAAALAVVVALPVLGADPSASPGATSTEAPKVDKAEKPDKAARGPEIAKELRGVVSSATDAKGRPTFSMTVGGSAWELEAGPAWYWGEDHPLKAFVGKTVKVAGTTHEGSTELDVESVDGVAIREPGKPPWAGGPKVQGERHPGWKAWKADKFAAKAAEKAARDAAKPDSSDDPDDAESTPGT